MLKSTWAEFAQISVQGVVCDKSNSLKKKTISNHCSNVGIRAHFHNLVKGFTLTSSGIAQLGLGHSYSRAKIKFNVHRVDNMIIQSIALLDQLDKDINTFSMRIR